MNKTNTLKEPSFHIGQLIKNELYNQGRSISWLANQVGCTRENFYKIMRRDWIYTDMLFKISYALDHDFFKDCSDYFNHKNCELRLQHFGIVIPKNSNEQLRIKF